MIVVIICLFQPAHVLNRKGLPVITTHYEPLACIYLRALPSSSALYLFSFTPRGIVQVENGLFLIFPKYICPPAIGKHSAFLNRSIRL